MSETRQMSVIKKEAAEAAGSVIEYTGPGTVAFQGEGGDITFVCGGCRAADAERLRRTDPTPRCHLQPSRWRLRRLQPDARLVPIFVLDALVVRVRSGRQDRRDGDLGR